jgi:hypothetical protein
MLRTLRGFIVYPNYRAIILPIVLITKACCIVVTLMVAHTLTPDTLTSTEKLYSGGRKPIFSGVYRNRQC